MIHLNALAPGIQKNLGPVLTFFIWHVNPYVTCHLQSCWSGFKFSISSQGRKIGEREKIHLPPPFRLVLGRKENF